MWRRAFWNIQQPFEHFVGTKFDLLLANQISTTNSIEFLIRRATVTTQFRCFSDLKNVNNTGEEEEEEE